MQDQYRRGVALGLTMAEVMILLIFGLLLLLVLSEFNQRTDPSSMEDTLNEFQKLKEQYESLSDSWDVLIEEHREEQQRAERLEKDVEVLTERLEIERKQKEKLNSLIEELLEELKMERLRNDELQKSDNGYSARLSGFDHPPCWPRSEEGELGYYYSFDITLTVDGYIVRRRPVPEEHRNEDVVELHKRIANDIATLSPPEFGRVSKGLFEWSKAQSRECRFLALVKDSTGQSNKDIYIERLRLLESMFYKHLDK